MKIMMTFCSPIILTEDYTRINTWRLKCTLLAFVMEQIAYVYLQIRITLANLNERQISVTGFNKKIPEFCAVWTHVGFGTSIQPD